MIPTPAPVTEAAIRLIPRIVNYQLLFSLGTALVLGPLSPYLLLLKGEIAVHGTLRLSLSVLAGGALGTLHNYFVLRRYRFLLRALSFGSHAMEPHELSLLSDQPPRIVQRWLAPTIGVTTFSLVVQRPAVVDLSTGITLALLGWVMVAAASLPLFMLVRHAALGALELAPPGVMREIVEDAERRGQPRRRTSRRLVAALATPAGFLALGTALIVNAHLRRADERNREETARVLARAAFERHSGAAPEAGLAEAMRQAESLGFAATVYSHRLDYVVVRDEHGFVRITTPLDSGSASVRLSGSTVGVLSTELLIVSLVAVGLAGLFGWILGRSLSADLMRATESVRLLGTEAVLSGDTELAKPRFRVVAELGRAIEVLAGRFRVFARAQERAIDSRESAARMRGMFLASVSHDLKIPLNAILGFSELVRNTEPITLGQSESLALIERRGRELLALIETILDAARVEAGLLMLIRDLTTAAALITDAIEKGQDLAGELDVEVVGHVDKDVPPVSVDRVRMPRALATFVGHALRTSEDKPVHVRAIRAEASLRIEIQSTGDPNELRSMLDPQRPPGAQHRGLALGLQLASAVVELHGGEVLVEALGGGCLVIVTLPAAPG